MGIFTGKSNCNARNNQASLGGRDAWVLLYATRSKVTGLLLWWRDEHQRQHADKQNAEPASVYKRT